MKAERVLKLELSVDEAKVLLKLCQNNGKTAKGLSIDENCIITELEINLEEVIGE